MDKFFLFGNNSINVDEVTKFSLSLYRRRHRLGVLTFANIFRFYPGDIIGIFFWYRCIVYCFEGLCISIRQKSMILPNVSFVLRNVVQGVGIEVTVSYYANRVYDLVLLDYKRKQFYYKRSKLYYLRRSLNKASRVI